MGGDNMRVGILGGTFNPIHKGHIAVAKAAYDQLNLDEMLIMPSGIPPHKEGVISSEDRLNMVRLATKDYPYMIVSDYEIIREGTTYTAETLTRLTESNPDTEYIFILGADSLVNMPDWYKPEVIFRLATIAVCKRNDTDESELDKSIKVLTDKYNARIIVLEFDYVNISSHEIRECVYRYKNKNILQYLEPDVLDYIKEHGLYKEKK